MTWAIRGFLAVTCAFAGACRAAEAIPRFTILVYNYAAISPEVLGQTEARVARLYGETESNWIDCPLSAAQVVNFPACKLPGPTRVVLRIFPPAMAERMRQSPAGLGIALGPGDEGFAIYATVFAHDAEEVSIRRHMGRDILLGHVIAHELGHLLLGPGSHSSSGIMHTPWDLKELHMIELGTMMFTPGQMDQIRTNLRARERAEALMAETLGPGKQ